MREFVSQSVQEYLEGKIDLVNLSVLTDTTVHLAKQLIEEVSDSWSHIPEIQDEQKMQQLVYVTSCMFRGKDPGHKADPGFPYNVDMADVADWYVTNQVAFSPEHLLLNILSPSKSSDLLSSLLTLPLCRYYLPTLVLLSSFKDVLQPNQLPVFKKGHFGTYNPGSRRENMSAAQQFNENKIVFLELLPEFALLEMFKIKMPVEDEITKGLVEFVAKKKTSTWLYFATQILLDVHHGLRHSRSKAFSDTRILAMRTKKAIEEYWDLSKTFVNTPKFWPKDNEKVIKYLHEDVSNWILEDALYTFRQTVMPANIQRNLKAAGGIEKHFLLKSHGVLCGLLMFNFTLRMQNMGLAIVNQWYDVPQMAYLYNIAQQAGVKGLKWPDMDVFIAIHGEDHIFIGG